jgi:sulfite reductase alpha subunit-like flavoprotein
MNEEAKLLSGGTAFERSLLSSVKGEAPSQALSAQMLGPIIGAPVPVVEPSSALTTSAATKWVITTAAALGVGGALLLGAPPSDSQNHVDPSQATTSQSTHTIREGSNHQAPSSSNKGNVGSDTGAAQTPQDPTTSALNAQRSAGAVSSKQKTDNNQLAEEMRLLDQARAALAQQKPDLALQLLGSYDARYPRGTLRQEATVLRVSALKATGQSDRAERLTNTFLKESPNSAHKSRLQADDDTQEKAP